MLTEEQALATATEDAAVNEPDEYSLEEIEQVITEPEPEPQKEEAVTESTSGTVQDQGEVVDEAAKLREEKDNLLKALHEERGKRRDLSTELAAIRAQIKPQATEDSTTDDGEIDPDVRNTVKKVVAPELTNLVAEIRNTRRIMSEEKAKARYSDFDQVVNGYLPSIVEAHPEVAVAIRESDDPAELAYRTVLAYNLEIILDNVRKQASQEAIANFQQTSQATKTIPSLSQVAGSTARGSTSHDDDYEI